MVISHIQQETICPTVINIRGFRTSQSLDDLCDWAPLASPTSLFPWYLFGPLTFQPTQLPAVPHTIAVSLPCPLV